MWNVKKLNSPEGVFTPIIPGLGRLRQEDCEFKARLGNIVNSGSAGSS
jgi:hypothetical protein